MSKFRIRVKLQGFELEIDGSREDAALIGQNIGQQMASVLTPMGAIIDGESISDQAPKLIPQSGGEVAVAKKARRRKSSGSSEGTRESSIIDFAPNASKFGFPQQEWKTNEKILWLMYVIREITGQDEFSNASLHSTFNHHFKRAGAVRSSNVSRDLGIKQKEKPSAVGENTTKTPPTWYLQEEGIKQAQKLVADALGVSEAR